MRLMPGGGVVNVMGFLRALQEIGYDGAFVLPFVLLSLAGVLSGHRFLDLRSAVC